MLSLRDYQEGALDALRDGFQQGHRAQMLYLPTGGGKTEIAIAMMERAAKNYKKAAMVLDRIVLCNQTSMRLDRYGIAHGVMQSGHWRYRPYERIQVCSAQTLEKRGSFPGIDLLIVDEAHNTRAKTAEFIKARPELKVVGLSASPFTKGLGGIYSRVVNASTTGALVEAEMLAPLRVYVCRQIDMDGAKKIAGEWSDKDASERGIKIVGDVVSEWVAKTAQVFGGPKKTIVFCAGVKHGEELARSFAQAGYNFVSVSYRDGDDFKKQVFEEFAKPDTVIHGLIATDILTKGFDVPDVMVGVSARPFSKSFSSHVQQMGRVMRSSPGKSFALWLDHSGNYLRFREDWEAIYSDGCDKLEDGKEKAKPEPKDREKKDATCPSCGTVFAPRATVCACCGYERPSRSLIEVAPGEMEEVGAMNRAGVEEKRRFYSELLWIAEARNYRKGWAANKYREKFGVWPRNVIEEPVSPSFATLQWVKSRQIAWAKARAA